ncbi:MAG: heparan-alpha-glucosaminide N-acetyltransferase domain-containing protein [Coriobacteriia bacterium]
MHVGNAGGAQADRVESVDVLRGVATAWMLAAHSHYSWDVPSTVQWIKAPGNLAPALFLPLVGVSFALATRGDRLDSKAAAMQLKRAVVILCFAGVGLHLLDGTSVPRALGIFDAIALSLVVLVACARGRDPLRSCGVSAILMYAAHLASTALSEQALVEAGVTQSLLIALLRQDAGFPILAWTPFVLAGYIGARWLWLRESLYLMALSAREQLVLAGLTGLSGLVAGGLWLGAGAPPDKWTANPTYMALAVGWLSVNLIVADLLANHAGRATRGALGMLGKWSLSLLGLNWFLFQSLPTALGTGRAISLPMSIVSMLAGICSGVILAACLEVAYRRICAMRGVLRALKFVGVLIADSACSSSRHGPPRGCRLG